jgi:hypothetical protein
VGKQAVRVTLQPVAADLLALVLLLVFALVLGGLDAVVRARRIKR